MKHLISGLTKLTAASILVLSISACGGAEERKVKYLEKGKAYFVEKNYSKAKIEIKNVLQIDPKFAEAYYLLGQLEEKNKELRKAVGNYKKAIELDKEHSGAKIKLARIYVIVGTKEFVLDAQDILKELELAGVSSPEADLISASIEYRTGDKTRAVKEIEEIVKKDNKLVEGISLLSTVYVDQGNPEKAIKLLTKAVADNIENIPLRVNLAKLHAKDKKYDLAEKYLKEVVALEPENYSFHVALASFYATSDRLEKAKEILRNAIKEDEDSAQRYLVLIELLSSRVNYAAAIDELKSSISKKPELYDLQFVLSTMYMKVGMVDEAKEVLNKILNEKEYDPEGMQARNKLALIYIDEGSSVKAEKYITAILAEHPNNNDALLTSAKLSMSSLDLVSAVNALRTVVKNEPKNTEASQLLAKAHKLSGESLLAENVLKTSIEHDPLSYKARLNYAGFLASESRQDESLTVVEKALIHFKDNVDLLDLKLRLVAQDKDEKQVLTILDELKRLSPQKPDAYIKKGKYFVSKREFDKALAEFEIALGKSNDKYIVLDYISRVYFAKKEPENAINRLNKFLTENENNAAAQQLLGQIYLTKKDYDKSRALFKQAAENAKKWHVPYISLATSYLIEQNSTEALKIYKNALNNVSNKLSILMKVAAIHEQTKAYKDAINTYNDILEINSTNILAANNLASLLLDHGTNSDIKRSLELTRGFDNIDQPALKDTLGWAYAKSGDNKKAVEILKPIVEKSSKIAVFRYHLGYALYQMGDKAAAKSHLDIAVSSDQSFSGKDHAKEILATL